MHVLVAALEEARATRARKEKVAALAAAFARVAAHDDASLGADHLATAARFATGRLLPVRDPRSLGVGHALVFDAAVASGRVDDATLSSLSRERRDLGEAVGLAFGAAEGAAALAASLPSSRHPDRPGAEGLSVVGGSATSDLTLGDVATLAETLASSPGRLDKLALLERALRIASAGTSAYLVKALLGELRVGVQDGLVLEAIAAAFGRAPADVRRAAALVTDAGDVARLALRDELSLARLELGRPVAFMLASPLESLPEPPEPGAYVAEDKVDGIRAQVHVDGDHVRIFGRGLEDVSAAFPDVRDAVHAELSGSRTVLDGEIVVCDAAGRPRPFQALQPRLRKLAPPPDLVAERPASLLVFDLLYDGESLLDRPLTERRARLVERLAGTSAGTDPRLAILPRAPLDGGAPFGARLDAAYAAARARGHEGVMLKRPDAPYEAGSRGRAWLKVKRPLATLDVVVTAAERGSGKRRDVLSDLTFAVRDGDALLDVGKAYSGLTDAEIARMTTQLEALTEREDGSVRRVRPEIVLEVAFDGLQRSERHPSGFALRFPRIVRIRDDKTPDGADSLETVRALFAAQVASGHREEPAPGKAKRGRPGARKRPRAATTPSAQLGLFDAPASSAAPAASGPRPAPPGRR